MAQGAALGSELGTTEVPALGMTKATVGSADGSALGKIDSPIVVTLLGAAEGEADKVVV